ncbi:MAG: FecR domain-containing protein [Spirochaetales bacterium]|nr:FecR domain-containing protein [Spirochaetales bacterium]
MKKSVTLVILLFVAAMMNAQDVVGSVTWIDGKVEVYRDGEALDWYDVDIGLEVKDFDLVETGPDGYIEVEVLTPGNSGTVVKISQNTAFYFEKSAVSGGGNKTTFQLLAGSLSMKVSKLTGNNAVDVRTESAVMGVRGTEFEVIIAPEASILIVCPEGKVEVEQDENDYTAYAEPGTVVRKDYNNNVRGYQVEAKDIEVYKSFWTKQREEVFRSGAATFIKHYAKLYNSSLPKFLLAYEKLKAVRPILEKYGTMEGAAMGTLIQAKKDVSPAIFEMRSIFPLFEHTFYSVQTLQRYHDLGEGQGMITDKLSSESFFSAFTSARRGLKDQLADTRRCFRLFLAIDRASGGGMGSDIMKDLFDSGNPFDGGGGMPQGNIPESSF